MILGINAKIFAYSRFGNPRDRIDLYPVLVLLGFVSETQPTI